MNRQLIGKQRGKQRGDGFESRLISIKKEKKEKSAAWIWEGLGRGEGGKKALGRVWGVEVGTEARALGGVGGAVRYLARRLDPGRVLLLSTIFFVLPL